MEEYINHIYNLDCIAGMAMYPDHSIDMILSDLPYGMTNCIWDNPITFPDLWRQYLRVIKNNGAIVLTACQPFTTRLISSNPKMFKYCWYWYKNMPTGFAFAKYQPMRCMEDICVFYRHMPTYNPQGIIILDKPIINHGKKGSRKHEFIYKSTFNKETETYITHYPRQLLEVKCERGLHPTQKPVTLFEYLIRTYTNPGELVLDSCMGSGTTAIACMKSGRNYTGFEADKKYYDVAINRIANYK